MRENQDKIVLEKLGKTFTAVNGATINVLENLDAGVAENEFIVIVGPSGCGKTTLLSIIAGFEPPTSGRVLVNGKPVSGPGRDRGVVFQETAVFPWRKVVANVEYGLEMQGLRERERRKIAMKYLEMVGLAPFADSFPKELSGGMLKRLSVATVFANNPDVLLMDESFSALDYPTKCGLQQELLQIWEREKKTTLFVTHDIEEALFLADRILVLKKGRFVEVVPSPFGRPRDNSLRDSEEFFHAKSHLAQLYWK